MFDEKGDRQGLTLVDSVSGSFYVWRERRPARSDPGWLCFRVLLCLTRKATGEVWPWLTLFQGPVMFDEKGDRRGLTLVDFVSGSCYVWRERRPARSDPGWLCFRVLLCLTRKATGKVWPWLTLFQGPVMFDEKGDWRGLTLVDSVSGSCYVWRERRPARSDPGWLCFRVLLCLTRKATGKVWPWLTLFQGPVMFDEKGDRQGLTLVDFVSGSCYVWRERRPARSDPGWLCFRVLLCLTRKATGEVWPWLTLFQGPVMFDEKGDRRGLTLVDSVSGSCYVWRERRPARSDPGWLCFRVLLCLTRKATGEVWPWLTLFQGPVMFDEKGDRRGLTLVDSVSGSCYVWRERRPARSDPGWLCFRVLLCLTRKATGEVWPWLTLFQGPVMFDEKGDRRGLTLVDFVSGSCYVWRERRPARSDPGWLCFRVLLCLTRKATGEVWPWLTLFQGPVMFDEKGDRRGLTLVDFVSGSCYVWRERRPARSDPGWLCFRVLLCLTRKATGEVWPWLTVFQGPVMFDEKGDRRGLTLVDSVSGSCYVWRERRPARSDPGWLCFRVLLCLTRKATGEVWPWLTLFQGPVMFEEKGDRRGLTLVDSVSGSCYVWRERRPARSDPGWLCFRVLLCLTRKATGEVWPWLTLFQGPVMFDEKGDRRGLTLVDFVSGSCYVWRERRPARSDPGWLCFRVLLCLKRKATGEVWPWLTLFQGPVMFDEKGDRQGLTLVDSVSGSCYVWRERRPARSDPGWLCFRVLLCLTRKATGEVWPWLTLFQGPVMFDEKGDRRGLTLVDSVSGSCYVWRERRPARSDPGWLCFRVLLCLTRKATGEVWPWLTLFQGPVMFDEKGDRQGLTLVDFVSGSCYVWRERRPARSDPGWLCFRVLLCLTRKATGEVWPWLTLFQGPVMFDEKGDRRGLTLVDCVSGSCYVWRERRPARSDPGWLCFRVLLCLTRKATGEVWPWLTLFQGPVMFDEKGDRRGLTLVDFVSGSCYVWRERRPARSDPGWLCFRVLLCLTRKATGEVWPWLTLFQGPVMFDEKGDRRGLTLVDSVSGSCYVWRERRPARSDPGWLCFRVLLCLTRKATGEVWPWLTLFQGPVMFDEKGDRQGLTLVDFVSGSCYVWRERRPARSDPGWLCFRVLLCLTRKATGEVWPWLTLFQGPVMFDEKGDRRGLTQIEQLQDNTEVRVGVYDPSVRGELVRWEPGRPIRWIGRSGTRHDL